MSSKSDPEARVREIRRKTRRRYSCEEKIRIVLEALKGEESVAELCRREGIIPNLSYPYRASIQKDADPDIPELIEARERLGEMKTAENPSQ